MKEYKKKVYLRSFGCQMNIRDSEVIAGLLRASSYELTAQPEDADIVIFNTCSVRQHAEDKVWSEVGRIVKGKSKKVKGKSNEKKPIIGIVGCMAQNYKEAIFEKSPYVDFVVGPSDIDKIPEIINKVSKCQSVKVPGGNLFESKYWETDSLERPEEIYHTGFYEDKEHAFVVISEGCSNYCSYCVVPYVRGAIHHRPHQDIIKEIKQALDKGITKITLLGQNVNAYQSQAASDKSQVSFANLLEMVNKMQGLKEFSFITSHPKDTSIDLFKAMADLEKLKKYLHLPAQAGSDKILELMSRGYTRKYYLDLIENYRRIVKEGVLTSDIIVGFSTETEKDFQDTFDLVKEAQFNAAFIFKYSPRPHTRAASMVDDVPKEEKERRHKIILDLQKSISKRKNAKA